MSDRVPPPSVCALQIVRQPSSWGTALVIGAGATVLGGLALAGMVLTSLIGVAIVATVSPWFRRQVAGLDEQLQLQRRRDARVRRLGDDELEIERIRELTSLVDSIDRMTPHALDRYDVEDLLDQYATVALARRRCHKLLAQHDLASIVYGLRRTPEGHAGHRRAVLERRLEGWIACRARADELDDKLATIEDLIRLLAERAAFPDALPPIDAELIDERLSRFTATEEELRNLEDAPGAA